MPSMAVWVALSFVSLKPLWQKWRQDHFGVTEVEKRVWYWSAADRYRDAVDQTEYPNFLRRR